ncbi:MAG: DNA polymerase III subunit delta [Planctomycetota bacterium]
MPVPKTNTIKSAAAQKPLDALADLDRALKSDAPKLILLTNASTARGDEPFLFEYAIRKITNAAEARGAEVSRYDAGISGFNAATMYTEISTRSMFALASVRIVRNVDALTRGARASDSEGELSEGDEPETTKDGEATKEKGAPSRSREAAAHPIERAALGFVKNAPGGDQLILVSKKFRAPFVRAVREAGGAVYEFRPLYDKPFRGAAPVESTELGEFVQILARELNMKFASGAMAALIQKTGSQLTAIASALEKLKSVLNNTEITAARVHEHIVKSRPGSPWILAEAILSGDAARALAEVDALEASGARDADGRAIASEGAYVMMFAALRRDGIRNIEAAGLLKNNQTIETAAAQIGIPNIPAVMESFIKQVRSRTPAGHRILLDRIAEAEIAMRLRGEKARSAVERLVARARVSVKINNR